MLTQPCQPATEALAPGYQCFHRCQPDRGGETAGVKCRALRERLAARIAEDGPVGGVLKMVSDYVLQAYVEANGLPLAALRNSDGAIRRLCRPASRLLMDCQAELLSNPTPLVVPLLPNGRAPPRTAQPRFEIGGTRSSWSPNSPPRSPLENW